MQKCRLKEGLAFVTFLLSASAMDSDAALIPGITCVSSLLALWLMEKKKEPARDRLKLNKYHCAYYSTGGRKRQGG